MREALTNAVLHGSGSDPARPVRCSVRLSRRELRIAVEDEGPGFDWRAEIRKPAPAAGTSGRGLEIFRRYASRFWFNEKGSAATIIKRFGEKQRL